MQNARTLDVMSVLYMFGDAMLLTVHIVYAFHMLVRKSQAVVQVRVEEMRASGLIPPPEKGGADVGQAEVTLAGVEQAVVVVHLGLPQAEAATVVLLVKSLRSKGRRRRSSSSSSSASTRTRISTSSVVLGQVAIVGNLRCQASRSRWERNLSTGSWYFCRSSQQTTLAGHLAT